jgi:hypothetical protein
MHFNFDSASDLLKLNRNGIINILNEQFQYDPNDLHSIRFRLSTFFYIRYIFYSRYSLREQFYHDFKNCFSLKWV